MVVPTAEQTAEPPANATLVEGFEHRPGRHCGSTALANLLRYHGAELAEGVVFGLAAGACFYYVEFPSTSPSRLINGRAAQLEHQFVELTDGLLELQTEHDPEAAWLLARKHLDARRPAILLTDLYYLDHYDNTAHFPGHAVVLVGYDSDCAYLADTDFEELIASPLGSLSAARHSKAPPFPLNGELLTVPDVSKVEQLESSLPELIERAVKRAARDMLDPQFGEAQGVLALRKLAREVESWPTQAEDWQWCARFAYQVIERRGTGGGSFRKLYSEFLQFAADKGLGDRYGEAAEQCAKLADRWTELAYAFREASESEPDEADKWRRIAELTAVVRDEEERLWSTLA